MSEHVTAAALSARIGLSARTVRRLHVNAEAMARVDAKYDRRGDVERERDAALLTAEPTPGGHLRWSIANAARVVRAFGKPVPEAWQGQAEERGAA